MKTKTEENNLYISREELSHLIDVLSKKEQGRLLIENQTLRYKLIELELDNTLANLYIKYQIDSDYKINYIDGQIVKKEKDDK